MNCIKYNCEHSLLKSIGYAGRNYYARVTGAYLKNVSAYACITAFQTKKLSEAGFAPDRMHVIPNFVTSTQEPEWKRGEYVAVSGRMSREKGIDLILDTARCTPHIKYVFAGTIREEDDLMKELPANCIFRGHLSKEELAGFYSNARFLVVASRWYEGFPMILLDAFSYGKPAIGPAHGGFLEIIDDETNGLYFTPGDGIDLKDKILRLWDNPEMCIQLGMNAYEKLKRNYTLPVVKEQWSALLNAMC
jgi:glycosyltransferase involved in cell wall biosynthesis